MSLDNENEPHMGTDSYCKQCKGITADNTAINNYKSKIITCEQCGYLKKAGWVPPGVAGT